MLPEGVRRLINYWSIKPGTRAVVLTADDRGLARRGRSRVSRCRDRRARRLSQAASRRTSRRQDAVAASTRSGSTAAGSRATSSSCRAARSRTTSCSPRPAHASSTTPRAGSSSPPICPPHVEAVGAAAGDVGEPAVPGAGARPPRREVLRLLLRGPDDEGPEVRDRRGLRLDRALEALHDRDDGALPGPPLPRQLDPRLREGERRRREHDRHDDRETALRAGVDGPRRRAGRRSRRSARRSITATRISAAR